MSQLVAVIVPFMGIDVAKDKLDVVLLQGQRSWHRVFANSEAGFADLLLWLQQQQVQQVHACLEATGSYSDAIAQLLYEQGHTVSVLNPAVLVNYRKSCNVRSKTDKLDASLLARYAQEHQPRAWKPLPKHVEVLRQLLAYRADVQDMLRQERNRLEAGRMNEWVRDRVHEHIERLQADLKAVEEQLLKHLKSQESLKRLWRRLQTIKGIGPIAAAQLLAHVGEIERFADAGSLVSLAGLAVKERLSGTSGRGRAQMDRHGRNDLPQVLYMCALTAMRWDEQMRAWAQRLKARGKPTKVVIVALMRKLLHIVYGVWKHERDYDPSLAFPAAA